MCITANVGDVYLLCTNHSNGSQAPAYCSKLLGYAALWYVEDFIPTLVQAYRCNQFVVRVLSCCTALRSDLFRRAMTRDRFTAIHSCLCFVDSDDTPSVPPSDPSYDRLWKIKPVMDHVLAISKKLYCMSKEVSLDEQMVSCRGRARGLQPAHPLT
jgi:hypothetical protein